MELGEGIELRFQALCQLLKSKLVDQLSLRSKDHQQQLGSIQKVKLQRGY